MSRVLSPRSSAGARNRRFELLQVVYTRQAVPELGLREGEPGTIVELFETAPPAYLVEFADESGRTRVLAELAAEQLASAPPPP